MSGILTGLKALREQDEKQEQARADREKAKVTWASFKAGETVELIFLQELDESSDRYSEKNGLGFFAQEHQNPAKDKFFLRMLCTNNEEHDFECWGCDKNRQMYQSDPDYKGGWRVRTNMYINVLIRRKDEDGEVTEEVAVLQRSRSKNSYVNTIIDLAIDDGFISNRTFRLTRKGEGATDTVYTLIPRGDDAGIDVESYELFDLSAVVRDLPYAEQAEKMGEVVAAPRKEVATTTDDDDTDDWL